MTTGDAAFDPDRSRAIYQVLVETVDQSSYRNNGATGRRGRLIVGTAILGVAIGAAGMYFGVVSGGQLDAPPLAISTPQPVPFRAHPDESPVAIVTIAGQEGYAYPSDIASFNKQITKSRAAGSPFGTQAHVTPLTIYNSDGTAVYGTVTPTSSIEIPIP
jgi:hypothetical protein